MRKFAVRFAALTGLIIWPPAFLVIWLFLHEKGDNFFHELAEGWQWLLNRLKDGVL